MRRQRQQRVAAKRRRRTSLRRRRRRRRKRRRRTSSLCHYQALCANPVTLSSRDQLEGRSGGGLLCCARVVLGCPPPKRLFVALRLLRSISRSDPPPLADDGRATSRWRTRAADRLASFAWRGSAAPDAVGDGHPAPGMRAAGRRPPKQAVPGAAATAAPDSTGRGCCLHCSCSRV